MSRRLTSDDKSIDLEQKPSNNNNDYFKVTSIKEQKSKLYIPVTLPSPSHDPNAPLHMIEITAHSA